jgi:hypothetical protein
MNIPDDNSIFLKGKKLSISRTTLLEVGFPAIVSIATWFGLRFALYTTRPFGCDDCAYEELWEGLGYPLFSTYVIPFVVFLTISAAFFVRAFRNKFHYFSLMGSLAFSFPLFILPAFLLISVISLFCLPFGFIAAIIATVEMIITRKYLGNWVSLFYNGAWLVIFGKFMSRYLQLYGD